MENKTKIALLRDMVMIREFESIVSAAKLRGEILGQVHCCIGQEAVVVGVCSALKKNDYVISNHRSHGHVLAKGANLDSVMAEIYGKATGTNGGKGGSMHIFDKEVGSICTTAIVGSGLPIGCGAAFASKFKNDGKITTIFFGDGATNEGTFGECLNLASTWKLPVIFLLENNGVAITTLLENASLKTDIYHRAMAYGLNSFQINGQDVEEVYRTVKKAIELINNGEGPVFIEAKTIRFNEHAEGAHYAKMTNVGYRDNNEIEKLKVSSDPIISYLERIIEQDIMKKDDFEKLVLGQKLRVENALQFALKSPEPSISEAYTNVYV